MTQLATVTLVRNPYAVPDVAREGIWVPHGPILGKKVLVSDRHWYKTLDVGDRLFAHHTLNSIRKDLRFIRPRVPVDALDLALSSAYVHSVDTLVPKPYVCMQPETIGQETWRVLRNQIKVFKTSPAKIGHPIAFGFGGVAGGGSKDDKRNKPERKHPSSLKLAIEGPHTDQTNPGFSRKIDGTFYSI